MIDSDGLTIEALLRAQAARRPEAPALHATAEDRTSGPAALLTFKALVALVDDTRDTLRAFGFDAHDRIGLIVPTGPEAATAFLAIAASAACAPLNPAYTREELEFYLSDLAARAVVLPPGRFPAAEAAAAALGLPVVRLETASGTAAGLFRLTCDERRPSARPAHVGVGTEDTALLLHTSGTTSRPKLVPLRQRHLAASAVNVAASLGLTPGDRCLNVMPLFHVHGLVGALLSSLSAGASVICTPGFNALRFSGWLQEGSPTWYTAVPTMHQSILGRARRRAGKAASHSLRFIRSCSAPLSPRLHGELEALFQVPVVEAYGMTEGAHQIACNPLPPGERCPGSVGVPTGTTIAAMDAGGRLLAAGETGEIAIRGPGLTDGYERNPEANARTFVNGWFRTGDQGHVDARGYVYLTGRLKEIINRGGEKISPLEIDRVLADHPAVRQAVAFAVPHDALGEDVAAAIVLNEGASVDEAELRSYAGARLAAFKTPARILFVDQIPKGPTGKLQRIGLAGVLGLTP